jgi:hypothetical protein
MALLKNHPFIDKVIIASNITKEKKYYLYVHYRIDKQEPFYIGIGTKTRKNEYNRAMDYNKRSQFWKRVANKSRYNVMIISESDSKEEIIKQEINYIKLLGKKKDKLGTLVNITDGGEGMTGHKIIWTEESKNKIRIANSKRVISEETREKLRIALKARGIINKKLHNGNIKESIIN